MEQGRRHTRSTERYKTDYGTDSVKVVKPEKVYEDEQEWQRTLHINMTPFFETPIPTFCIVYILSGIPRTHEV